MDALLRRALEATEISPLSGSEPRAAVALILAGDAHELLLIRRSDDPNDPWSGHMALPGGRHERQDESLVRTAVRETAEEVGVSLPPSAYVGALPPARARSRSRAPLWVAPFVFRLSGPLPPTTLNHEVAEVIWVPLLHLTRPEQQDAVEIHHEGSSYRFPAFRVEGRKVWGLTFSIVSRLLELIEGARR